MNLTKATEIAERIKGDVLRPGCPCCETVDIECEIPAAFSHTGNRRKKVCGIDKCLAPLIRALQAGGISTTGCCCGHGECNGTIDFEDGKELIVIWPWDYNDRKTTEEIISELKANGVDVDAFMRRIDQTIERCKKNIGASITEQL